MQEMYRNSRDLKLSVRRHGMGIKQDACRKIIDQTIEEILSINNQKPAIVLLNVLTDMIRNIENQYFDASFKQEYPFYFESSASLFPLVFLQRLIQRIPLLGSEVGTVTAVIMTQLIGSMAIDFYERRDINDYLAKARKAEANPMLSNFDLLEQEFEKVITIAKQFVLDDPDRIELANEGLLNSDAFLDERPPVIAITGTIGTGKSSLINALFGEKKAVEGLHGDNTNAVGMIQFQSRLLIYDTPGADGNVNLENITRAFFGLDQIDQVANQSVKPVDAIPTIELHGTKRLYYRQPEDFEKADLIIFVRDVCSVLGRAEIHFLNEIIGLGKPVIILLNKIDSAAPEIVEARLNHIQDLFTRQDIIPVSTKTGENLKKLLRAIITKLPAHYDSALSATVDKQYEALVRTQEISLYALVTAVKTAWLVGKRGHPYDMYQLLSNVMGLYVWIVSRYRLSDERLHQAGIGFDAIAHSIQRKQSYVQHHVNPGKDALLGTTLVLTLIGAIATTSMTVPLFLFIGAPLGGGMLGGLNAALRRNMVLNLQPELEELQQFIAATNRFETTVSVFAFGQALCQCCEALISQETLDIVFSEIFQKHYTQASEMLKPFEDRLNRLNAKSESDLIQEIFETVV